MMDRIAPLLPSALDPAMASSSSLASFNEDGGRRPSGSSLVARGSRMSNATRQKATQGVLHSYKHDVQLNTGPLRRKASTAPTAWPRDTNGNTSSNKSNRDSLEMSLDAWNMDATKKQIQDRRIARKRETHLNQYTVTVPFNANTNMLESPTDRRNGDSASPFVLPPGNAATVTPTKPPASSFFSMFSSSSTTGSPVVPRTPSSTSPARPSTVRRLARTLLEWNLGPQTDLTRWQRDSPRASRDMTKASEHMLEDNPMRSPD